MVKENVVDLLQRTRRFALRCLKVADALPKSAGARAISFQLAKSGTSVAANYRSAQRARSKAEFRAKLQISMEEADETLFWLGLIADSGYLRAEILQELTKESDELTAILVASLKTARRSI